MGAWPEGLKAGLGEGSPAACSQGCLQRSWGAHKKTFRARGGAVCPVPWRMHLHPRDSPGAPWLGAGAVVPPHLTPAGMLTGAGLGRRWAGGGGSAHWVWRGVPGPGPLELCCRPPSSLPAPACPERGSGAGACPQPAPQMPRAASCPGLPRELLGPFFLLSSRPGLLDLRWPFSYRLTPPLPGSAPPAPTLLATLAHTLAARCPMVTTTPTAPGSMEFSPAWEVEPAGVTPAATWRVPFVPSPEKRMAVAPDAGWGRRAPKAKASTEGAGVTPATGVRVLLAVKEPEAVSAS